MAQLAVLLAASSTLAQTPRLSRPGDAEGDAVRQVASAFYAKLADADAAGARTLFAGPPEQAQLIDATVASNVSMDRLLATLEQRFGKSDALRAWQAGGSAYKRRQAEEAKQKLVVIFGDQAVVAGSALADLGLRLRKEGDAWKVVALTPASDAPEPYVALSKKLAAAADSIRTRAEAGGFYRVEPALQEVVKLNEEAMADFNKAMDETPATPPPGAVVSSPISAEALAALPGKAIDSPEVTHFLASLASLPELTANGDGTVLTFQSAGVQLGFDPKDNKLTALTVHDDGDAGFAKYPGPLPLGLQFGARRADIEKNLGLPVWSLGQEEYAADFPTKGVTLTFAAKGARDPDAALRRIDLVTPQTDAPPALKGLALRYVAASTESDAVTVPLVVPDPKGMKDLRLQKSALVEGSSIIAILPNFDPTTGNWGVELTFSPEAGKALAASTANDKGKTLAIVVGDRIFAAVPLDKPLGERLVINLGNQVPPEAARGLAGQLHAATFTLP